MAEISQRSAPPALRSLLKKTDPGTRQLFASLLDEAITKAEALEVKAARQRQSDPMVSQVVRDRADCKSFHAFVMRAWHVLEPSATFVDGWHLRAICEHLEAVTAGKINRLLINVPPGSMKSLLVSVMWPAWEWAMGFRSYRYIATAFAEDATARDTRKMRDLVISEWYQARWPEVQMVRKGDTAISNSDTGFRECSPFGSLTSKRGDRLLIDDPHSVKTAESDVQRADSVTLFREGALNRLNDQKASAIVVIMQRLHEHDISGTILALKLGYVHLCLPMEFEIKRRCITEIGFRDPRTIEGELLDPVRFPREEVEKLKKGMGAHAYAGQYQQRPSAREGGMFKRHWFVKVKAVPIPAGVGVQRIRRWDLAASLPKPGTDPDYTVGLRMCRVGHGDEARYYIEDVVRFRDTALQVRRSIRATAIADGKSLPIIVPEDPGQAGKDQAQNIVASMAGYIIRAFRETGDKGTRADPLAVQFEAGNVFLLEGEWNEDFIEELCAFPRGHDDQVDAASGAFAELVDDGDDTRNMDLSQGSLTRDNPLEIR